MAGKVMLAEKKAFRLLHYFDEIRGEHSTGLATVKEKTNEVKLYKKTGGVHDLWDAYPESFDDKDHTFKAWDRKVFIGHNRFATVGEKTDANAHPFTHGNITGAHNGTLTSRYLDQLDGSAKFEVDSEAIFYSLNKNGIEKTINSLHGAWALVWWDAEEETVNFIRNKERTLYYCWSKDHKTFFWASEEWMLKVALGKNGIEYTTPILLPIDMHHELHVPGHGMQLNDDSFVYYGEKLTGFQPPITNQSQPWWGEDSWETYIHGRPGNNFSVKDTTKDEDKSNVVLFPPPKKDSPPIKDKNADTYLTARKFLNKEVEFNIYGEREGEHVGIYLLAAVNGVPNDWEVRLFAAHHPNLEEWRKGVDIYTGIPKGITNKWNKKTNKMERYLSMDLRSVKLVEKKEEKTVPINAEHKEASDIVLESNLVWDIHRTYEGYNGERLSFTEFMKAVNAGCIWCGERVTSVEADTVAFVQPGRLVCTICLRNGHALKYHKK